MNQISSMTTGQEILNICSKYNVGLTYGLYSEDHPSEFSLSKKYNNPYYKVTMKFDNFNQYFDKPIGEFESLIKKFIKKADKTYEKFSI